MNLFTQQADHQRMFITQIYRENNKLFFFLLLQHLSDVIFGRFRLFEHFQFVNYADGERKKIAQSA